MSDNTQPLALFTSSDGQVRLQLKLVEQNLWLTQRQIAELFEKSPPTINEHLKNIYEEGELDPASTIRKFRTVALEGARSVERLLDHYNLESGRGLVDIVSRYTHTFNNDHFRQRH